MSHNKIYTDFRVTVKKKIILATLYTFCIKIFTVTNKEEGAMKITYLHTLNEMK